MSVRYEKISNPIKNIPIDQYQLYINKIHVREGRDREKPQEYMATVFKMMSFSGLKKNTINHINVRLM